MAHPHSGQSQSPTTISTIHNYIHNYILLMHRLLVTISAISLLNCAAMATTRIQLAAAKASFVTTILLLYILPVVLLVAGVIPFRWRFQTLLLISLGAILLSWRYQYSPLALGFNVPRLLPTFFWILLPIALFITVEVIFRLRGRQAPIVNVGFFLFFVFVSAPAQEFIYRSFLFAQMDSMTHWTSLTKILVSAALYSLMHVIYRDELTLFLTFAIGLVWAGLYVHTRSFAIVALSHAVLGALAIFLGVI